MRGPFLLALLLMAALGDMAGALPGREVKILARGAWPHVPIAAPVFLPRKQLQWVIRSQDELAKTAGKGSLVFVLNGLQVEAIDFDKQMIVAVGDGTQPLVGISGGGPPSALYRVEITALETDNKTMTVHWRRVARGKDEAILTYPLEMALVPRFQGDVTFDQLPMQENPAPKAPAPEGKPSAGKAIKILAKAFWPDGQIGAFPQQQWVVRKGEDLVDPRIEANSEVIEAMRQAKVKEYAQALHVDSIDFTRHMILGVSGGVQRTGGYRVAIARVEIDAAGRTLTVTWKLQTPSAGQTVAPGLSHPAEVVLVEQFDGEVTFKQEPD